MTVLDMRLLDFLNRRPRGTPEQELRRLLLQVMDVLREMEGAMASLPPEVRQGAHRSFDESVGESMRDLMKRLEKMERKLLSDELDDIPRSELNGLRERMSRLDEHLIRSYLEALKLTGDRNGRKAIRASARRRADQVEELLWALERVTRRQGP